MQEPREKSATLAAPDSCFRRSTDADQPFVASRQESLTILGDKAFEFRRPAMSNDYAMTMIDRMLSRGAHGKASNDPIDPALRATVDRLVDELRAINFRRAAR
jgi:hypothetical protein